MCDVRPAFVAHRHCHQSIEPAHFGHFTRHRVVRTDGSQSDCSPLLSFMLVGGVEPAGAAGLPWPLVSVVQPYFWLQGSLVRMIVLLIEHGHDRLMMMMARRRAFTGCHRKLCANLRPRKGQRTLTFRSCCMRSHSVKPLTCIWGCGGHQARQRSVQNLGVIRSAKAVLDFLAARAGR